MSVQMDLGFRQVDAEGRPIRRTAAQVAAILQLPEKRCADAFSAAFPQWQHSCLEGGCSSFSLLSVHY